jgi:hypothetical protein
MSMQCEILISRKKETMASPATHRRARHQTLETPQAGASGLDAAKKDDRPLSLFFYCRAAVRCPDSPRSMAVSDVDGRAVRRAR